MTQRSRQDVTPDTAVLAACILAGMAGFVMLCHRPSAAMVDPNDCIPGVLPRDGHMQTSLVRIAERDFDVPFIAILSTNWLRDRNDPNALKETINWIHPASDCRVTRSIELAGDLTADGRIDLYDLHEYARWWMHEWVPYP